MYVLRRSAIAVDRKTRLEPARQAARSVPTGNHSSGQADSDGPRRLHPVALLYIIIAGGYLTLLYVKRGIEKHLKGLQYGATAINLINFSSSWPPER